MLRMPSIYPSDKLRSQFIDATYRRANGIEISSRAFGLQTRNKCFSLRMLANYNKTGSIGAKPNSFIPFHRMSSLAQRETAHWIWDRAPG